MERTGSRKYSVPRLASVRREDAARRAMPTSSSAGLVPRTHPGAGAEAPLWVSQSPWRAAGGNRVRLVSFGQDSVRGRSVPKFDRRMGEVAIGVLTAPKESIRYLFACQ